MRRCMLLLLTTTAFPSNLNRGVLAASAASMNGPVNAAIDPVTGNLYIADATNNRILEYSDPVHDSTADRVFGQLGDFATSAINKGGVSADTLNDVAGV